MDLSKTHRELISRATALLFGLFLCYGCWKCIAWGNALRNDPMLEQQRSSTGIRQRKASPIVLPYGLALLLGGGGVIVVGYSVLPTKALHAINPMYDQTE